MIKAVTVLQKHPENSVSLPTVPHTKVECLIKCRLCVRVHFKCVTKFCATKQVRGDEQEIGNELNEMCVACRDKLLDSSHRGEGVPHAELVHVVVNYSKNVFRQHLYVHREISTTRCGT